MWYKDAVFYQIAVRSFKDSNGDGYGDLRGITEKLDYLQTLGVDCLWLMPIYPSPLRDDGYDISDYYSIDPIYGNIDDFKKLIDAAHARDIRIIMDLVLNHTSDQHPWFQASRSDRNSPFRDYYVWSDSNGKYSDTRIIFIDTESSNWTLEPSCGLYYWHRFYSHQPDLNYDNPRVREEILDIARFWLDLGVDGFRVDAAPFLFEREGTTCDNLPETHAFFKELRKVVDGYEPPRMILAEANQKTDDLMSFFGRGDEFHMAFHFPLMPRLFMSVHQESARPLVEILSSPPRLPEGCQWAMFLRNHDELTLEMLGEEERSYMLSAFGANPSMRFNLGIRRRLWPLMMGGRRQIELLHGLILGLPGSAVFYYGDEIGMGDDLQLGERFPVRTPMQWSSDRNAGFSRAETSRLTIPVIRMAEYHYAGHNVESLDRLPTSFLNWFRRMIKTHREVRAFRSREARLVETDNPHILAFEREKEGETALCVYNLSRFVQPVTLHLAAWRGRAPVEVIGGQRFPSIGDRPYFLSLGPHSFMWFRISPPG